ncbi:MAG: hypothetical protein Q9216_001944 [Gyalolechia sp. 2 TL-2023]
MSAPASGGSGGPDDNRTGLSKFVRRASKVFRRRSSARKSISVPTELTQTASGAAPAEPSAPVVGSPPPIEEATVEEQPTVPPPAPTATQQTPDQQSDKPPNSRVAMTAAAYGTIQEERARALFAKYGLTLEPGEWTLPIRPDAQRVEKRIRMRVHRTCHKCQTTFGPGKVCGNCEHVRCKKCLRFPPKRVKESKDKVIATTGGAAATVRDTTLNLKSLTISSHTTGKKITYKPVTQRVRRTCHMCSTLFPGKTNECVSCGHHSCRQCPREPYVQRLSKSLEHVLTVPRSKLEKYPEGYPGDSDYNRVIRERHPIRVHVRWRCHECDQTFRDLSRKCEGCGHERCDNCPRQPPKREKPKLNPEAVKSVGERMRNMDLSPQASAA